jgi:hypothetical protein
MPDPNTADRQRLSAIVARQDAERGRPLSAAEQLDNLSRALAETPEEWTGQCGICGKTPCNYHGHYPVPVGEI